MQVYIPLNPENFLQCQMVDYVHVEGERNKGTNQGKVREGGQKTYLHVPCVCALAHMSYLPHPHLPSPPHPSFPPPKNCIKSSLQG